MKKSYLKKHSKFVRTLSIALCLCLLVPSTIGNADTIEETKTKIQQLEDKKAELNADLNTLKDDESKKVEYQETLEAKIEVVQTTIDEAIREIDEKNAEIRILEAKLEKAKTSIEKTLDWYYARVKALYKSGSLSDLSALEILLNSTSLTQYTMLNQAMTSFSKHDEQQLDKIRAYQEETETDRVACEEKKQAVADLKLSLEQDKNELKELEVENAAAIEQIQEKKAAAKNSLDGIESESSELMGYLEQLIAEKAEADRLAAEEAARQAEISSSNSGSNQSENGSSPENNGSSTPDAGYDGGFNPCWPIPGVTYVSQYYGNNGHKGMDIAGPYGTPIVAAESGQVLVANDYDPWGDSWGYYVLLYHNGTYTTRYAHLSSLTVSKAQYVSKGQLIGYEGSTGNSTGPHLHFEVYQNGSRVNPSSFIGG